jgi:hypothetical protein
MTSAPADPRATDRPRTRLVAVLLAFTTLLLALGLGTATSASAKPRQAADPTAVPVSATGFTGFFDVTRFTTQNGTLMAVGTLTGTVTDAVATGGVPTAIAPQQVAFPVDLAASGGSCEILDLVLGPLDLNLLGLEVHLDQVHLNITAQQGPGNLLGNLLCAIAGLLDGPTGLNAILNQIATLLNQLLGALG